MPIAKSPVFVFKSQPSSSLVRFHVPSLAPKSRNFPPINPPRKWTCGSKSLRFSSLTASCAPASTVFGGWDDEIVGVADGAGKSDALRNFLVSAGIADRKNVFVFLLGLVCAMAFSRIKVSTIIVLPASVLIFAIGFSVGYFKSITFHAVRINGSNRREKESVEKLRSLVKFFDELDLTINNFKSDVQSAIRDNKIEVDDCYGYVEVSDYIKLSAFNARNIVQNLMDDEENSNGVLVENHKTGRRKKGFGEAGYRILRSVGSLFGENPVKSNSTKVRENVKQETLEKELDQTQGNGAVPPVEDGTLNLIGDHKATGKLDSSQDSSSNYALDVNGNGRIKSTERETFGLGDMRRRTKKFPAEKEYSYRNNGLRFTNNHSFSLKMNSNSITDISESHDNLLSSDSFKVRMKRMESESSFMHEQLLNRGLETFRSSHYNRDSGHSSQYKEDRVNYDDHRYLADDLPAPESEFNSPLSAKVSDDMVFDRYLAEASDLLKQAKELIKDRHDEEQVQIMLYRSSNLLSKAVDLKPMSLLAVGQLGNTYLLHGELKLKISRELRTLLSGRIQSSSGKHSRILKGLQSKITSKEEVVPLLVDVCEECEELLVQAGRKYKLALSIDGNDVRALYNWGLALSFRGQLIADIGPVCFILDII